MSPTIALIIGVCTATIPLMASSALLWARIVARPAELARVLFVTSLSLFCLLAGPWAWLTVSVLFEGHFLTSNQLVLGE